MKMNKPVLKNAFLATFVFLLTFVTTFQVQAGGRVCLRDGDCNLATSVNCGYIRFSATSSGSSTSGGARISAWYPPDSDRCSVDTTGSVDGVAPPFVPPQDVVLASTVVTYYHNDALGSPASATDGDGEVLWKEEYRPYGTRLVKEDGGTNSQWFTGKPHEEEFGLSYFGARWYDPESGRFMGVDPVGVDPGNMCSFNRYAYANNNPYGYADPDGKIPIPLLILAAQAAKFGIGYGIGAVSSAYAQFNYTGRIETDKMHADGMVGGVVGQILPGASISVGVYRNQSIKSSIETAVTKEGTTVIGRVKDLQKLNKGEKSLLDRLPDQGSPKANWKQNSGVLREEMAKGKPIRDASPGDTTGQFLNAERNLLESRGWTFDKSTNFWNPPQ